MILKGAEDIQMYKSKTRMIQSSLGSAQLKEQKNSGKKIYIISLFHRVKRKEIIKQEILCIQSANSELL